MVKNAKKLNILRMEHNFSMKQKKVNLCLRWHILRGCCFVAEVTFKQTVINNKELIKIQEKFYEAWKCKSLN